MTDKQCETCHWMPIEIQSLKAEIKRLKKQIPKEDSRKAKEWRKNFEWVWEKYPEKKGKHQAWIHFKAQVKTDEDLADIIKALNNYKDDMAKVRMEHPERPWLHGSTWFNHRWEDFINYQAPGKVVKPYQPTKVEPPNQEDSVPPAELKKLFKDFNIKLKGVPKASNKFVEPL